MDKVIEQLKELRNVRPDRDWVNSHRELLLSQITCQNSAKPQSVLVNSWFLIKSLMPVSVTKFMSRPVGIITAIMVVIFSSGIFGVSASRNSVPGDLLYSVKLTGEKMKVSMSNNRDQAKLHAEFAVERSKEIEKVLSGQDNDQQKKNKIMIAVNGLESEMKQAQTKLENSKIDNKDSAVVEIARQIDARTTEISESIVKNKEQLKEDIDLQKTLTKAQATVEATGVKAIEIIIEKKNKGVAGIDEKALVERLDQKITNAQEIAKQVEATAVKVETAPVITAEPAKPVEQGNETTTITPIEINISTKTAKETITEAKDLLNNGDLTQAIQKVAETAEITRQAVADAEVVKTTEVEKPVVAPIEVNLK